MTFNKCLLKYIVFILKFFSNKTSLADELLEKSESAVNNDGDQDVETDSLIESLKNKLLDNFLENLDYSGKEQCDFDRFKKF